MDWGKGRSGVLVGGHQRGGKADSGAKCSFPGAGWLAFAEGKRGVREDGKTTSEMFLRGGGGERSPDVFFRQEELGS